jgi:glycosyltransferase involved in cell wall biosynthesis
MSLVVIAGTPDSQLFASVEALKAQTLTYPTEVVVACESSWDEAPEGVKVVVTGSGSRGERLDRAAENAVGDLLAFVDSSVRLPIGWQERAVERLRDPKVGAVGGPQLLPIEASGPETAAWLVLSSVFGSGPLRYRFRRSSMGFVPELPSANLVLRRDSFKAVGGFQCPNPMGEEARLCYKLRSLLGLRILYDPDLAVQAAPPALFVQLLSLLFQWGRKRGDLARRLPETSRRLVYGLPAAGLPAALILCILALFAEFARIAAVTILAAYVLASLSMVLRSGRLRTGILAASALPLSHLVYAVGFWRGFLGRSMGEVIPGRLREKPLRVLIFNWRDVGHPWAGGAESYMHELARRWVKSGCEVGWVSQRYATGKRLEVIDGIRVHRVGGRLSLYPFACLLYLLRLRSRYDVVIDCENGIPFFTPIYCRKPTVLVVFHIHSEVFRHELPRHLKWLALWLESSFMPTVYRHKRVVTISDSTMAELRTKGFDADHIQVVTPGVEINGTGDGSQRANYPSILYIGRLKRYKSVDLLLAAMSLVLSDLPDARLSIVGQGPERERLERIVWKLGLAGAVRFYGYVAKDKRDEHLRKDWVLVCPSLFEGWGSVCLEANANGMPVVATRVAGLRDSVIDGTTGVLVPHGDTERLASELVTLLRNQDLREAMGLAGRSWAQAHRWDESAERFLQVLQNLRAPDGRPSAAPVPSQQRI